MKEDDHAQEACGHLCSFTRLGSKCLHRTAILLQGLRGRAGQPERKLPATGPFGFPLDWYRKRPVSIRWLAFLAIWTQRRLTQRICAGFDLGPRWAPVGWNA